MHLIALIIHIAAGTLALLSGTTILVLRKGTPVHRRFGKAFFWSMVVVALSAFTLSLIRPNSFLFMVGAFTLYQALSGQRAVHNRKLVPTPFDGAVALLGLVNGVAMLASGHTVLLVFGGISLYLVVMDVRTYVPVLRGRPVPPMVWLQRHIGHMMGAYIAAFTAFIVVNLSDRLGLVAWLAPTAIGVPLLFIWTRRFLARPPAGARTAGAAVLLLLGTALQAQPYVEGGHTRHRFAQLTLGTDVLVLPGEGTRSWQRSPTGPWSAVQLSTTGTARILIGGTHFWGHAHFGLAIPLAPARSSGAAPGVEVSARYFPWRIEAGRLRPSIGVAFVPTAYRAEDGPRQVRHQLPFGLGLSYLKGAMLLQATGALDLGPERTYPSDRGEGLAVRMPRWWVTAGISWMFDTTLGAERGWSDGSTQARTTALSAAGRLDGITVHAGAASLFLLGKASSVPARSAPHVVSDPYPEFGLGYFLDRPDLQFDLTYRRISDGVSGYGDAHTITRTALTAEVLKFLGDHHGFAPFIGPAFGPERIEVEQREGGEVVNEGTWRGLRAGITAGWDIRPDRLQWFILRTASRWWPALRIDQRSGTYRLQQQLEVGFIQLVLLPGRW